MPVDVVVVGLGYVGLPLVSEAVNVGLRVVGLDVDERRVGALNAGRSHVDDLTDDDLAELLRRGFSATTDPACLAETGAVVVCVPTPLGPGGVPDLGAVEDAARVIRDHLRPGQLVVLESTTYPGTTDEVFRPILEESGLVAGSEFHLAFSPERIDPGNEQWGLRNTPKVVGGHTDRCTEVAEAFYGKFVESVVRARGTREAEMAKLLENTYRHVNIALVNEMAVFCDELGVDLWDAIACASTKPFGFQAFYPGAGVGGHCIPIDPNYLSFKVRQLGYQFRFVELAQEINDRMPAYVASRAQSLLNDHARAVRGSRILLLGVTFKPNIADERGAPAQAVARRLLDLGALLTYHDPYVPSWTVNGASVERVDDLDEAVLGADLVVVVQAHREYDFDSIAERARLVFDATGRATGDNVTRL